MPKRLRVVKLPFYIFAEPAYLEDLQRIQNTEKYILSSSSWTGFLTKNIVQRDVRRNPAIHKCTHTAPLLRSVFGKTLHDKIWEFGHRPSYVFLNQLNSLSRRSIKRKLN